MKPRVALVVSSRMTVDAFLLGVLAALDHQYDVTLIGNFETDRIEGVTVPIRRIGISRDIDVPRDLAALRHLFRLFKAERFDLVHSFTPKAGSLGALAARLAGIPCRLHTFTGQLWAIRRGVPRVLLRAIDALISRNCTHLLADSPSQRQFLIEQGIVSASKIRVIGPGSLSGIDSTRFRPDPDARALVRSQLGVPAGARIVLFVGRLKRDKGVLDLVDAFDVISAAHDDVHLVIAGPDEEHLHEVIASRHLPRLHLLGWVDDQRAVMAAADVYCLPSYREGSATTILEAAATSVPTVASRITGIIDSVRDGETGLLHIPGDIDDLVRQLAVVLDDEALRLKLGRAARQRVVDEYQPSRFIREWLALYSDLIGCGSHARATGVPGAERA